ncbi:TetR family transcriptional regulator [Plantactinospora sp. KLBMP9567]|uniref:TetR family transcriptional regulator n=1 Tax=Plantactinospora sp. KLBMP9567 TaxID=3085900 RepID=UPI0029810A3A|nr:TetR family transcriptional regulator [Plantactinospora sp. KLBMP9567]MDW5325170.1 TetR family transcriptional regulator [Plantactinospora sp. KLBMP9567]
MVRTREPEAKRRQLVEAALAEFAAHGLAGARIDRIAGRAGCSAGLVYTYFGSKDDLFDAVFDAIVGQAVTEIPITPEDLPGYAGRLFDATEAHPDVARIATWYRLERAGAGRSIPAITEAGKAKAEAIRAAQRDGIVSDRFDPEQVVALVLTLATMWSTLSIETAELSGADRDHRRATVVDAVRRLVEPH